MLEKDSRNWAKLWYAKYWEVLSLIPIIIIGLFLEDRNYALVLFSLSVVPLLYQVINSKSKNTGIFFIILLKFFKASVLFVKAFHKGPKRMKDFK